MTRDVTRCHFLRLSENLRVRRKYRFTNEQMEQKEMFQTPKNRLNKVGCSCVHAAIVISNI